MTDYTPNGCEFTIAFDDDREPGIRTCLPDAGIWIDGRVVTPGVQTGWEVPVEFM